MGKGQSQSSSPSPTPPSHDVEKGAHIKSRHKRKIPPPPPPPQPWKAWLTPTVFVAYIAIFIYTMLKELGALDWKQVVEEKEYWRLFTCMWLHAGLIHLLVNMISLLSLGIRLEKEFGFLRIGALYMVSGLGASLTSELSPARKQFISVGASGALFGLLGAMLSELITNWTNYTNKCAALSTMVLVIGLNLAVGFIPHVDNSAHIGGFIYGLLAGFVILIRPQYGYISSKHVPEGYRMKHKIAKHNVYQYGLLGVALVLLIMGFGFGLRELFAGRTL